MASIFSRIIAGEIPCYKVAEDEGHIAFLDINPIAEGHTLVVPKHEVSYIFDLPEGEYLSLCTFARRVAEGLQRAIPCKRIGEAVLGLEVPHTHIHLVPLNSEGDMNFARKLSFTPDEMEAIRSRIASEIKL